MALTKNLSIPRLNPNQRQAHVTHNEALDVLDVVCQLSVLDKDLFVAPVRPPDGSRYIVGPNAAGAWFGKSGQVAAWVDGAWEFHQPKSGWICYVRDEGKIYIFNTSQWETYDRFIGFIDSTQLANGLVSQIGVNMPASATNRLAVSSNNVLLNNSGQSIQTNINKRNVTNDAAVILQANSSSRVITGLLGSGDYTIRTSSDGNLFNSSLRTNSHLNGRTFIKQGTDGNWLSWTINPQPTAVIVKSQGFSFSSYPGRIGSTYLGGPFDRFITQCPVATFSTDSLAYSSAGIYDPRPKFWLGNAPGLGGFYFEARFAIPGNTNSSMGFIGLSARNIPLVYSNNSILPVTIGAGFGVGWDFGSSAPIGIVWQGGGGGDFIPLEPPFFQNRINLLTTPMLELVLSVQPGESTLRGHVADLTNGITLPFEYNVPFVPNNIFLTPHVSVSNGFYFGNPGSRELYFYGANAKLGVVSKAL